MAEHIEDFEEAFRVIKTGENTWRGAHPLRLPVKMARGVYGGNTIAQTLLVAIESTRQGDEVFIPESFHLYFVKAGNAKIPMEYEVNNCYDDHILKQRDIKVIQKGKIVSTALCTLRKQTVFGQTKNSGKSSTFSISPEIPQLVNKYPEPNKLHRTYHTDYVRNAYSDEFVDYNLCPEEKNIPPAERWITVWSGTNNIIDPKYANCREEVTEEIHQTIVKAIDEDEQEEGYSTVQLLDAGPSKIIPPKYQKSFTDPMFNLIGLANLSDSALLTTLARILHIPWNPTEDHPFLEYDGSKDAKQIMVHSLNAIQIFHYSAMSLDHHIYFHIDNFEDDNFFDVVKEWLCFSYQVKRLSNNRSLVRGHLFNEKKKCVATVIQEGLTYMFQGIPDNIKL